MKNNTTITKKSLLVISFLIIAALVIKLLMYSIFPPKYFYDANHIIEIMNGSTNTDASYSYAANFFNSINILGITSLQDWGLIIMSILLPILLIVLFRNKNYSKSQYIFIISNVILLLIYVFGVSKDIIQFIYFTALYFILVNERLTNRQKIIVSGLLLLLEALNFRVYYALMLGIMIPFYIIYVKTFNARISTIKRLSLLMATVITVFIMEILLIQIISPSSFGQIANARAKVNYPRINSADANTIIHDQFGINKNIAIFACNYILNLARILFPIELIKAGPLQIIFIIYQIFLSVNLFISLKKMSRSTCLYTIVLMSFIMMSAVFEPDFGSLVRHESAIFLIALQVINSAQKTATINNNKKIISSEI